MFNLVYIVLYYLYPTIALRGNYYYTHFPGEKNQNFQSESKRIRGP